jgi:hypothetical protein
LSGSVLAEWGVVVGKSGLGAPVVVLGFREREMHREHGCWPLHRACGEYDGYDGCDNVIERENSTGWCNEDEQEDEIQIVPHENRTSC